MTDVLQALGIKDRNLLGGLFSTDDIWSLKKMIHSCLHYLSMYIPPSPSCFISALDIGYSFCGSAQWPPLRVRLKSTCTTSFVLSAADNGEVKSLLGWSLEVHLQDLAKHESSVFFCPSLGVRTAMNICTFCRGLGWKSGYWASCVL